MTAMDIFFLQSVASHYTQPPRAKLSSKTIGHFLGAQVHSLDGVPTFQRKAEHMTLTQSHGM